LAIEAWGLDVVGPITLKSSADYSYILAATNYFSKWAEAIPLREVKKENIVDLFERISSTDMACLDILSLTMKNYLAIALCEKFNFA